MDVGVSEADFAKEATFLLAAKFYEQGKLSSGQAAQLCGKERVEFLYTLPTAGVSISNLSSEEAKQELEFARNF